MPLGPFDFSTTNFPPRHSETQLNPKCQGLFRQPKYLCHFHAHNPLREGAVINTMAPTTGSTEMLRKLPQFRVALNSRCERACFYCRPSGEGLATAAHTQLPLEHLIRVAAQIHSHGIRHIKLTGGDPALYPELELAVFRLRHELGFEAVEIISRHPEIGRRAQALAEAGVTLFNMSIDTLDPAQHRRICGVDDLDDVLRALDRCIQTGVPCKVNVVVMGGINDREIPELIASLSARGVQSVKLLDVIADLDKGHESFARRLSRFAGTSLEGLYVPLSSFVAPLLKDAKRREVRLQGDLGHPMTVLHMNSGSEVVLKDSAAGAWYGSVCEGCAFYPCHDALMALRLTADTRLQFCLLREEIGIRLTPVINDPHRLSVTIAEALGVFAEASFHRDGQIALDTVEPAVA
jgi:cyclic pyranopterin phosphate synthase